mmetsp:Transcript_47284/g.123056  ORF Transcript_47284/g.123056 Transcript_47284/m.123056 type:complete len:292 (+) Transcript_47284:2-877(+)
MPIDVVSLHDVPPDTLEAPDYPMPALQPHRDCRYCHSESLDGWEDEHRCYYCEYCWSHFNGRILDEVTGVAARHARPDVVRYEDTEAMLAFANRPVVEMRVEVVQDDCLVSAQRLHADGHEEPCVLAKGRPEAPGGLVGPVGKGQLGELCRGTTYQALVGKEHYPLAARSALYVPGVVVFRVLGQQVKNFHISIVVAVAICRPALSGAALSSYPEDSLIHVAGVLRICAQRGHRKLILNAWGCGAYGSASIVARAFRIALEGEFRGCFSHVVFAINNDDDALRTFKEEFAC